MILQEISFQVIGLLRVSQKKIDSVAKRLIIITDEHWFIESRNVIVRLHGQSGRDEALMVNAHYGKSIRRVKEENNVLILLIR